MKSKLTLRLDAEVKERAKKWAERHGTSVSKVVENYFRVLTQEPTGKQESDSNLRSAPQALPPITRRLKESLGRPAPELDLDDDTTAWIDAAAEKHQ